jgi:hypothetical protein
MLVMDSSEVIKVTLQLNHQRSKLIHLIKLRIENQLLSSSQKSQTSQIPTVNLKEKEKRKITEELYLCLI